MVTQSKKISLLVFLLSFTLFAEEKKETKVDDSEKKINEEVLKRLGEVKNKTVTDLTRDLLKKEDELKKKEKDLAQREEMLKVSTKDFEKQMGEFKAEQDRVLGCLDKNQSEQAQRINQLVKMISDMKPTKSAEILSVQDSQISVLILSKIDPVKASKIFNLMDKEISARLQKEYLNMKK